MDFEKFRSDLIAERDRIDAILKAMGSAPAAKTNSSRQPQAAPVQSKRKLTQAAKNKIAAAQRERWAQRRKKTTATKAKA